MNTLTPLVVVAETITRCTQGTHDVTMISDGRRVVSFSHGTQGVQITAAVERDGARFTTPCVPDCEGTITLDTSATGDTWRRGDHVDALMLDTYAQEVCPA